MLWHWTESLSTLLLITPLCGTLQSGSHHYHFSVKHHFPNTKSPPLSPCFSILYTFFSSYLTGFSSFYLLWHLYILTCFWDWSLVPFSLPSFLIFLLLHLFSLLSFFSYTWCFRQLYLILCFQMMTMLMISKCITQSKSWSLTFKFLSLLTHLTFIPTTHIY